MRIVVVGAGLSGLSIAHQIRKLAQSRGTPLDLEVFEAAPRAGGNIATERVGGFLFESGPNGFLDNVPEMLELIDELGLGSLVLRASPAAKKRFVYRRGRLHDVPLAPGAFLFSSLLSLRGKARLAMEPLVRRRRPPEDDETVAAFGRRRLGREATATLLDPFVSGVFAGDIEKLSVASAFPLFVELERERGSLFNGLRARAADRRARGQSAATLTTLRGGMQELIRALEARLSPAVRLSVRARSVERRGGRLALSLESGGALEADRLVLATPAFVTASLVEGIDGDLARELREIPYSPVAVIAAGFERSQVGHPLDGFGYLAPRGEGLRTLGTIFCSSAFEGRAPDGHVLLRTFAGGARDPEALASDDASLLDLFRRETGTVLRIRGEPVAWRIFRHSGGIPQYVVGHAARLRRSEARVVKHPGLHLAGNSFKGISMNDCVRQAAREAAQILD